MLKHMLTQTGSHPKSGNYPRPPSTPNIEVMYGSPILETRREREAAAARRNDNNRPVSVHGSSVIYNQSIYAATVPLSKMNVSGSAPGGGTANGNINNRLNASSMNANLNLSSNQNTSSSNASPGTNQTRTTNMDSSREHDLNSTQISPISANHNRLLLQQQQQQNRHHHNHNMSNGDVSRSSRHNSSRNSATFPQQQHHQNGGLNITNGLGRKLNASLLPANVSRFMVQSEEAGVREMIVSLGLLCLVSLLLALLSLVFLLKISPSSRKEDGTTTAKTEDKDFFLGDFVVVHEVTLAMCALSLSLNLCCLLVCAIQFLFAVKLVKSVQGKARTNKYLKEASLTRICAIAGFFISIPVFLTGIILYTFIHFDSTPAIITSVVIGMGIIFCGAAVVHNVFVWQRERMKALNGQLVTQLLEKNDNNILNRTSKSGAFGLPTATLDLSGPNATVVSNGLELSTLV